MNRLPELRTARFGQRDYKTIRRIDDILAASRFALSTPTRLPKPYWTRAVEEPDMNQGSGGATFGYRRLRAARFGTPVAVNRQAYRRRFTEDGSAVLQRPGAPQIRTACDKSARKHPRTYLEKTMNKPIFFAGTILAVLATLQPLQASEPAIEGRVSGTLSQPLDE